MGRKGGSTGLKRKPAPRFWPIHRKDVTWIVKPSAGPHSLDNCLPLTVALRDILGLAETRREAKSMVSQGKVLVDGRTVRKDTFPIGLMDVVSMPDANKHFRVLPSYRGLFLSPISKEEANFKLGRVENKRIVDKQGIQISFHDGSNISYKVADVENPVEVTYQTLNTLKLSLPDKQVLDQIGLRENIYALITGGKNIGKHGKITEIEKAEGKKRRNTLVTIEDDKGTRYQTILNFVMAVGQDRPLIALPEAVRTV